MKQAVFSILTMTLILLMFACNSGPGTGESQTDTITKLNKDIDTVKMVQQDTCIPEKKVDNSVPE